MILVSPAAATPWPSGRLNRILVPLDESDLAESALAPAEELASSPGSEILLVEVVPFPPYSLYDNGAAMAAFDIDKELATAGSYVARIAARLKAKGVQVRTRVELAHPTMSRAEIAASQSVDLIVMATHGRSRFARQVLGSVATGTLQHTRVPLMLIGPAVLQATAAQPATASATAAPVG